MTTTNESTNWREHAACKGMDTNIWFPSREESDAPARAVCRTCPVSEACNTASMDGLHGLERGIWAGRGHRGRREQRIAVRGRKGREPEPIKHGTAGGYQAHYRQGIPACEWCREAMIVHRAAARARKKAA